MADSFHPDHTDESPVSPQRLAALSADLRVLHRHAAEIPGSVDQQMRIEIRRHFAKQTNRRALPWRIAPWAGAVAALLGLAIWLNAPWRVQSRLAVLAQRQSEDVDSNGRIDILDAFSLARAIDEGQTLDQSLDLNHDGAIDRQDVNIIAFQAVSLDKRRAGASS